MNYNIYTRETSIVRLKRDLSVKRLVRLLSLYNLSKFLFRKAVS